MTSCARTPAQCLRELSEASRFLRDKAQTLKAERPWDVDALGGDAWGSVTKALDSVTAARVMCGMAADALDGKAEALMDEISGPSPEEKPPVCPRCGKTFSEIPVRSRHFDVRICPRCGRDEGFRSVSSKGPLPPDEWFRNPRADETDFACLETVPDAWC